MQKIKNLKEIETEVNKYWNIEVYLLINFRANLKNWVIKVIELKLAQ